MSGTIVNLLKKTPLYCAVVNRYAGENISAKFTDQNYTKIDGLPLDCFINARDPHEPLPPSPRSNRLLHYYTLEVSSLLPVLALQLEQDDTVLDMCSAPGGKAFAMLQMLSLQNGGLALNEPNHARLKRLKQVVASCVPASLRHALRFSQRRGEEWGKIEKKAYDKVLVDAPCSSDRHHIEEWIQKGKFYPDTHSYSHLQPKLLLAALHAVKSGGTVVYATCTSSEFENDDVIDATLNIARDSGINLISVPSALEKEYPSLVKICSLKHTRCGCIVVPQYGRNMYISMLHTNPRY